MSRPPSELSLVNTEREREGERERQIMDRKNCEGHVKEKGFWFKYNTQWRRKVKVHN